MENNTSATPTRHERREQLRQEKTAEQNARRRTATRKRVVLWGAALATLILIVVGLSRAGSGSDQKVSGSIALSPNDWIKGSASASTTLVEYSDFQCPACASYYPLVKQLHQEFGDRIAIAYRHYPLPQHQNAEAAAAATEAAGNQGKFWDMHDLLFERQKSWEKERNPNRLFTSYAGELKLDMKRFANDLNAPATKENVAADRATGNALRLPGTPTFFLNGKQMTNPLNYEEFKRRIADVIAR